MPRVDGFRTLERLAEAHLPLVVFVTAHDQYAVHAFQVHALDYLLKPLDDARLAEALRRGRAELALGERAVAPDRGARLLDAHHSNVTPGADGAPLQRFCAHEPGPFHPVPGEALHW